MPKPYVKKVIAQEIPLEKVYGRGAFDDAMKDHNRLNEWSFVVPNPGAGGRPTLNAAQRQSSQVTTTNSGGI